MENLHRCKDRWSFSAEMPFGLFEEKTVKIDDYLPLIPDDITKDFWTYLKDIDENDFWVDTLNKWSNLPFEKEDLGKGNLVLYNGEGEILREWKLTDLGIKAAGFSDLDLLEICWEYKLSEVIPGLETLNKGKNG